MRSTLSEAIAVVDREFVADSKAMSLARDASDGVLVTQAIAVQEKFESRSFLFGLSKDWGSSAQEITDATVRQFSEFGTPGRLPRKLQTIESVVISY